MSLTLMKTASELLVSPEAEKTLRAAVTEQGRAVLLVPSFAQALAAQRALAAAGGLSFGVTVTTPSAWSSERWEVWGDGRRLVDAVSRDVLCARVVTRAAAREGSLVRDNPGTAALVADLARVGLPQLVAAVRAGEVPEGVTAAERAAVELVSVYADELAAHGLVEESEVMAALPGVLDKAAAEVPPLVLAGFSQMARPVRELVCGLARVSEVTFVCAADEGAASEAARTLAAELKVQAGEKGVAVGEAGPLAGLVGVPRVAELEAVRAELFEPAVPVEPTGAVRLLVPAGPSARPELVASQVEALAGEGVADVVLAAPDPVVAWGELAPRLVARGISVCAQLSVAVPALGAGRAFLEYVRAVAHLSELAEGWPEEVAVDGGVRVAVGDMSWWPPRELSDFLLSDISGVPAERARVLDAGWRANRLLTPGAVIEQLQAEKDTSPEVAAATRELLRGRLGSAASKLLAPYVQGERAGVPAAHEATAALGAVLALAKSLKELGITADPAKAGAVSLTELVRMADAVLARTKVALRLERVVPNARATARIMGFAEATALEPGSADALVALGQTSAESPVSVADDVRSALLEAYGVEARPNAMAAARARFAALVGVPCRTLALERALFGADGKPCYPSVMFGELVACYGLGADAKPADLLATLGADNVLGRGEQAIAENASWAGAAPGRVATERPDPAGRIAASMRDLVSPPPEGVPVEGARLLLSASQIETYLECPYKWFSLRRLRLRDADAGFTGAEKGTFAHRVLEVTHRELLARAMERAQGGHALADLRASVPDAMQQEEYGALVEGLVAQAQADPTVRVAGSSLAAPGALEEACAILAEEFDAHLSHQYQLMGKARKPLAQALVAHSSAEAGQVDGLKRDLLTLLDYEAGLLQGYEPRFFEWSFGRRGMPRVEYAGVELMGTVDRIDVDAHGQAAVIDYKHKSDNGFAGEYDVFSEKAPRPAVGASFSAPRRVQSLIYGQVVRRAFPNLTVRSATYLCTKGAHALAGAVDEDAADNVFGEHPVSARRGESVLVGRAERFGTGASAGAAEAVEAPDGMSSLLDATEEAIGAAMERLRAGDIEAHPLDAAACQFCPVLNCERRLEK